MQQVHETYNLCRALSNAACTLLLLTSEAVGYWCRVRFNQPGQALMSNLSVLKLPQQLSMSAAAWNVAVAITGRRNMMIADQWQQKPVKKPQSFVALCHHSLLCFCLDSPSQACSWRGSSEWRRKRKDPSALLQPAKAKSNLCPEARLYVARSWGHPRRRSDHWCGVGEYYRQSREPFAPEGSTESRSC